MCYFLIFEQFAKDNYELSDKTVDGIFFQLLNTCFHCIYIHIYEYTYPYHEEIE